MPIRLTRAVKALLIACFAVFVAQMLGSWLGLNIGGFLALTPSAFLHGWVWQIVTYAFLHADPMHLFFNLLMLAFIGWELEAAWGTAKFLKFYFFCSVFAGVVFIVLEKAVGGDAPMLGASGAIYGLLAAYGILFSERVLLLMMIFPLKAKHFVLVLALIEFMTTLFQARLASVAHLAGMGAGYLYLWGQAAWKVYRRRQGEKPPKPKKRKSASHLKLVVNKDDDQDQPPKIWH